MKLLFAPHESNHFFKIISSNQKKALTTSSISYTSFLSEEAKSDPKTRQEELKERARMLLEQVRAVHVKRVGEGGIEHGNEQALRPACSLQIQQTNTTKQYECFIL